MIIIPRNTPRRAASKMKIGELAYYESLEAEFKKQEAKKAANKDAVESLQALQDRHTSLALRMAIDPNFAIPDQYADFEKERMQALYDFQDLRNAVPSPRWENELKAKFGKCT